MEASCPLYSLERPMEAFTSLTFANCKPKWWTVKSQDNASLLHYHYCLWWVLSHFRHLLHLKRTCKRTRAHTCTCRLCSTHKASWPWVAGSLFSWWIWYWLYGPRLRRRGPDMDGCLPLRRVSWSGWIDLCIDNSLFLSGGSCFMASGGGKAEVRQERARLGNRSYQLPKSRTLRGWVRIMERARITHLVSHPWLSPNPWIFK